MSNSYKVTVIAGTKVVADMAQKVSQSTVEASLELKPIAGGSTEATAVLLTPPNPLPVNSNRKRTKAIGWYKNATGPAWEAPAGADNTNWWSYETGLWNLGSSVPMPAAPPVTKDTIQPFAYTKDEYVTQFMVDTAIAPTVRVNNVNVTDNWQKQILLKKLDQAFKSIKVFGLDNSKCLLLRQFTYIPNGAISIGFTTVDNISDMQDINVLPTAFYATYIADYTKPFVLKFPKQYTEESYIVTLDMTAFGTTDSVTFNFRNSQQLGSYQTCGIKFSAITYLPKRDIWGTGFNLISAGSGTSWQYPRNYYFHNAVKAMHVSSKDKSLVRISGVSYNAPGGFLAVVIMTCNDNDPNNLLVSTGRSGFAYLRINLPITDTGVRKYTSFVLSGASTVEVTMVIDMTYLIANVPDITTNGFGLTSPEIAHYIVSPTASGGSSGTVTTLTLVDGEGDFQGNFRFIPATGNWAVLAGNYMSKLIRIPDGATDVDVTAFIDGGNSNVMLLDNNLKMVRWGYDGANGSINLLKITDLIGIRFLMLSTTTAPAGVKVVANGIMEVNNGVKQYRSVNEGLSDKYSGPIFEVNGALFRKEIDGLCTINEYKSIGGWLDAVPEYEKDGDYIIPTNVLHSDRVTRFTGGTLCAVKEGVMYFYNAKDCAVFKSEDGGATYSVICDKFSHPGVWDTQDINTEGRSTIHVLDNGELIFPIRVRGEIINPEINQNRYRYWTLYRTTGGQTDIAKCFEYSYESSPDRPWLPDNDPQRTWPNHSGGCPLGDFTQMSNGPLIVVTEYGAGTSIYWNSQVPPVPNNGRGVSSRAWVSFDYGITWKKMFDGDRKITGEEESDNNWFYFTSTYTAKMRHMHGIGLDKVRGLIDLTNGDNEDYVWRISLDNLKTWYDAATAVDPNERPSYKTTDTFPVWEVHNIVPSAANSFNAYSSMRAQMMQSAAVAMGHVWGHDASREFCYMSYYNKGEFIFEPVFQFEQRSDFDSDTSFAASWVTTDGFVQQITKHNGIIYFTHSNGGTRPSRVWATIDGFNWKVVYQGENGDIKFAGKILLDSDRAYLSDGTNGQASNLAGFWKLRIK